jgi:NAD(P)H-nitrite reductase large subunit
MRTANPTGQNHLENGACHFDIESHFHLVRLSLGGHVLVCHCHKVCHRRVLEACDAGAESVEEVGRACGAGTSCGGCRPLVEDLIRMHRRAAASSGEPQSHAPAA